MPKFTDRPLAVLDRLYDFVGGFVSPQVVETAAGIQLVHDVSREVEASDRRLTNLGPDTHGEFVISSLLAHVGAGTAADFIGIYANQSTDYTTRMGAAGIDPLKFTVWILGISMQVSANIHTLGYVAVDQASSNVGGGTVPVPTTVVLAELLALWDDNLGREAFVGAGFPCVRDTGAPAVWGLPFPIYNKDAAQSPVTFVSEVSGAGDAELALRCIALPLGVTPS